GSPGSRRLSSQTSLFSKGTAVYTLDGTRPVCRAGQGSLDPKPPVACQNGLPPAAERAAPLNQCDVAGCPGVEAHPIQELGCLVSAGGATRPWRARFAVPRAESLASAR